MSETVDVRHEAPPREHPPVSDLALWTSVLSGPLVFLLNLEVAYIMVDWACNTGHDWAVHVVHLVSLALAVAGVLLGIALWRRVGGGWPDTAGGSTSRARLLAVVGTLGSLLFAVSILAQWIPVMVLGTCPRA
ncbi:MAG TPA: hypothetical protein VM076_05345 [Gemmatimonadaceae bacterium]|nr:hypothetical protein [Gemmatimonadaceae bacterium]